MPLRRGYQPVRRNSIKVVQDAPGCHPFELVMPNLSRAPIRCARLRTITSPASSTVHARLIFGPFRDALALIPTRSGGDQRGATQAPSSERQAAQRPRRSVTRVRRRGANLIRSTLRAPRGRARGSRRSPSTRSRLCSILTRSLAPDTLPM